MPDSITAPLTREEIERRRRHMGSAIESARIEGGEVGPEARAIMDEYCSGRIDTDEMVARIRRRHVQP